MLWVNGVFGVYELYKGVTDGVFCLMFMNSVCAVIERLRDCVKSICCDSPY